MKSEKVNVVGPSDGLKKAALLSPPSNVHLVSDQKLNCGKAFFGRMPKIFVLFFFQLPDLKNDILGVGEVAPVYQMIKNLKNLKMDHLVLYSIPVTVLLNTCTR